MNNYEKAEFYVMLVWSVAMIPISVYAVLHGKDVPMGLSTAYVGALGTYAVKVTWGS